LAAAAAVAQVPGSTPRGGPRGGLQQGDGGDPMRPGATIMAQVREQLAQLEEDLRLTPAQQKPWLAYATNVQKLVEDVARSRTSERFPKGTALQQFEALGDTARNRLTAIEEIIDSGKAFYATLDARQQELADRRLARLPLPLVNGNQPAGGPISIQDPPGGGRPPPR
jgi:hypothetical protein